MRAEQNLQSAADDMSKLRNAALQILSHPKVVSLHMGICDVHVSVLCIDVHKQGVTSCRRTTNLLEMMCE